MARLALFEKALRFVQKKHRGQFRAGRMPTWKHLLRVAELLRIVLDITKEGTSVQRALISTAALGHDLIEDTNATRKEIEKIFTKRGYELIVGMTNTRGDADHREYIRSMAHAEEAVRLIKLSDLYDNFTSVVQTLPLLGKKWTTSFFLPIVVPMHAAIKKTKFTQYKKTAALLIAMVDISEKILQSELRYSIKAKSGGK